LVRKASTLAHHPRSKFGFSTLRFIRGELSPPLLRRRRVDLGVRSLIALRYAGSKFSPLFAIERELILSRISEGRKRARQNGIKFGRKPKLTTYQQQEALERLAEGESQSTIARSFNVDRATISRLARR
jgi:hypothetical protein